jgi:GxxExxY protein
MSELAPIPEEVELIMTECIGVAIAVHRELGPGFKEIIYRRAYCLELDSRGLKFECEKAVLVRYRGWMIPGQRLDLVVGGGVLVEIKALPRLNSRHERQVISYLKSTGLRIGLLLNFHARLMRDGMQRLVY